MTGESRVAAIDIKLLKRIRVQLEISAVQLKKSLMSRSQALALITAHLTKK
jgi:hypothetical protein